MTVDDPGENIREIAERIDVVEFTGLDQRCDGVQEPHRVRKAGVEVEGGFVPELRVDMEEPRIAHAVQNLKV